MAPNSQPLRVLCDNSALRLMALADPDAEAVNALQGKGALQLYFGGITIGETLKGFVANRLNAECASRCRYLLKLDPFLICDDPPRPLLFEIGNDVPHPSTPLASQSVAAPIMPMLREAARGTLSAPQIEQVRKSFRFGDELTQESVRVAIEHPNRSAEQGYPDFAAVLAEAKTNPKVATNVQGLAMQLGLAISLRRAADLQQLLWLRPKDKPYLVSYVRSNLFQQWHAARHGRMTFQDDLLTIGPSMLVDLVLTNDRRLFNRGRAIYPEVGWARPSSWSAEDIAGLRGT